jgi:hypothetical protein
MYSPNYLDCNSADNPNIISPKIKDTLISSEYIFPPHSYTIIAIPVSDIVISVNEYPFEKVDFNILPNPADKVIYFDAYGKQIDYIEIYDFLGKLQIKLEQNKTGFLEIDINQLETGAYLLKAKIEGKEINSKFVKK